jgi:hypothetical protein
MINELYNWFIKNKYKNYIIILDNANIYSLEYNPYFNQIDNFFSQLKIKVLGK